MSVRTTTSLTSGTVTRVSTGEVPSAAVRRRKRPEAPDGVWNSPVARREVDYRLLQSSIDAAGGDPNRLWFANDGSVWILNHSRGEKCVSPACPACNPR